VSSAARSDVGLALYASLISNPPAAVVRISIRHADNVAVPNADAITSSGTSSTSPIAAAAAAFIAMCSPVWPTFTGVLPHGVASVKLARPRSSSDRSVTRTAPA